MGSSAPCPLHTCKPPGACVLSPGFQTSIRRGVSPCAQCPPHPYPPPLLEGAQQLWLHMETLLDAQTAPGVAPFPPSSSSHCRLALSCRHQPSEAGRWVQLCLTPGSPEGLTSHLRTLTAVSRQASLLNFRQVGHPTAPVSLRVTEPRAQPNKGGPCFVSWKSPEVGLSGFSPTMSSSALLELCPPQPVTMSPMVTKWLQRSRHCLCIVGKKKGAEINLEKGTSSQL